MSRTSLKRSRVVRIKIISYESFIGNEKLRNEPIGKYIFTSSRILKDNYYVSFIDEYELVFQLITKCIFFSIELYISNYGNIL